MTWSNHQPQAVQLKYQFQINVKWWLMVSLKVENFYLE
jgi:hypothetical protein